MTFDTVERSAEGGRPVEIYTFARDYERWRYTSADRDVVAGGLTFKAKPLSRTAIETTAEKSRLGITLTAPRDLEVVELFRISPPTLPITCLLQQYHEGDGSLVTIWAGRVLAVEFAGNAGSITLEPIYTSLRRVGLRRMYQRQCPHVLYGAACTVNREAHRIEGTVESVAGLVVNVPEVDLLADGFCAGGYLEWEVATGIVERRFITDHVGQALTLSTLPVGLIGTTPLRIYPGCDHTLATCEEKFANTDNYGGMPYIPIKNPFGGDPIF